MKTFLLGLSLSFLVSINALATDFPLITGTVVDVECTEFDPYVIGDACVVFTREASSGLLIGLLYDDYDWSNRHVPEPDGLNDVIGDDFEAKGCSTLKTYDEIFTLKHHDENFFYVQCNDVDNFNWK